MAKTPWKNVDSPKYIEDVKFVLSMPKRPNNYFSFDHIDGFEFFKSVIGSDFKLSSPFYMTGLLPLYKKLWTTMEENIFMTWSLRLGHIHKLLLFA